MIPAFEYREKPLFMDIENKWKPRNVFKLSLTIDIDFGPCRLVSTYCFPSSGLQTISEKLLYQIIISQFGRKNTRVVFVSEASVNESANTCGFWTVF